MRCPKCGHEQRDSSVECPRCGIVFRRYRAPTGVARESQAPPPGGAPDKPPPLGGAQPPSATGAAPATPATTGWEAAVVGSASAGTSAPSPSAWSGDQIYGGPLPEEGAGAGHLGAEARHELSGNLYQGGPDGGNPPGVDGASDAAAVGMAMRPAPRPVGGAARPGAAARSAGASEAIEVGYGQVMGDALRIFFANLLPFLLIGVLVEVPFAFATALAGASVSMTRVGLLIFLGVLVAQAVLVGPLLIGAYTYGVAQELRHREATVVDCLRRALGGLLAVFLTAILQGLLLLGGFLLCVVPGVVAAVVTCVAVPATLEERCGPLAALHRSADLTRGHRGTVFFVVATMVALQALAGAALPPSGALRLGSAAASLVLTAFEATALAVLYYRLRSAEAGVEVAALPSIFD